MTKKIYTASLPDVPLVFMDIYSAKDKAISSIPADK